MRSNGAVRKCSSIAWKPASIARKCSGPIGDHRRQPDRRVHRVPAADPVPESEHVARCRCRRPPPASALVDTATKCRLMARSSPSASSAHWRAVRALVIVSSVVKVFDETMNSVSAGSRSRVASAKSVPSTFDTKRKRQVARAVVLQRLVGHDRTEIGAADPDVDDGAHAPAGVPAPAAVPDLVGERRHPIEHLVHVRARRRRRRGRSTRRAAREARRGAPRDPPSC